MINLEAAKVVFDEAMEKAKTWEPPTEIRRALQTFGLLIEQHRTLRDNARALSDTYNYGHVVSPEVEADAILADESLPGLGDLVRRGQLVRG